MGIGLDGLTIMLDDASLLAIWTEGAGLYVSEAVTPSAPVPGVPNPELYWYIAPAPTHPKSTLIADAPTLMQAQMVSVASQENHATVTVRLSWGLLSTEAQQTVWPGFPRWNGVDYSAAVQGAAEEQQEREGG